MCDVRHLTIWYLVTAVFTVIDMPVSCFICISLSGYICVYVWYLLYIVVS